jgi:DNA-3-methyladenine glycosylase
VTTGLISREFLSRPAQDVAPDLLGCVFEHETADGLVAVALTEVEAYAGEADPASHAYRGRTGRNAVMYGPAGHAYVYFTYGMHFCVNVVCMPPGTASAVLLRAGEVIAGEELARARRGPASTPRDLARGPARLCQALGIDRRLDGADLCDEASPLRLRKALLAPGGQSSSIGGLPAPQSPPGPGDPPPGGTARPLRPPWHTGPRVGVREGADVPWRFWLDGAATVSAYRPYARRKRPSPRRGE